MSSEEKPRILVIDDDPELQNLVTTILERANMEPIPAINATQAAQILRQRPLPHVIILDMMLPDVSGIEFLRQLRAKDTFDDIPVVILSAVVDPDQIREGLNEGADRYLTKPYLANNLVSTISDILRTGRKKP